MAFVTGQDATGEISVTLFTGVYQRVSEWLQTGQVVFITGKVEQRRDLQVVANQIQLAQDAQKTLPKATLYLRVQTALTSQAQQQMYQLLQQNHGTTPVILYNAADKQSILLNERYWVVNNEKLTTALTNLLGTGNVILKGFDQ